MIKKELELVINTGQAANALQGVDKAVNRIDKDLTKTEQEFGKINTSAKNLDTSFKKVPKSTKKIAGGFKLIGTAIKAAGIALVVGLFIALKTAMEQNQKAIDALAVVMETISVVMAEVSRVLTEVYESVASATENFDALGKVMGGIVTLVLTPFKLAFQGIKAAIVGAQLAWEDSFLGGKDPKKIKELQAQLDEIKEDVIEIGTEAVDAGKSIVENAGEALTEVADIGSQVIDGLKEISIEAAIETAKTNVELKKTAELASVANQGLIEKYDLQAEQQRQIRDEERNSLADRKKANDELLVILDKQESAMLANANAVLAAAQADTKKFANNVEFQKAEMEALNELAAVRATVAGFRSEQLANDLALSKEELEMSKSKLESENNLSIERKRFNAEQIKDEKEKLLALQRIDAEEAEVGRERLTNEIALYKEGTQAKVDAEIALAEFEEQIYQQKVNRTKELADLKVTEEQKASDKSKEIARLEAEYKENIQAQTLSAISSLIQVFANQNEKNAQRAFQLQKGLAIVETLINTSKAIMKVAAETTDVTPIQALRTANMISIGLAGAAQVAAIASQKFNPSGSSSGSVPSPSINASGGTSPSQAPSFNVVGQSGFNQIAGALGQQQPVQAFVVAGAVTNAQQLQNNTIQTATF